MSKSLQQLIDTQKYALQTIPLASSTPIGKEIVWIIVEDEYDKSVYSKFLNKDCHIFISQKSESNTSRSCLNVEYIVSTILNIDQNIYIFGIRDRDYTLFDSNYVTPNNIFYTDTRDIEMMMFKCEDVQNYLRQSYSDFDTNFVTTLTYAKEIGYLRIFNDINQMGFNFKRNLHFNFLTIPNYSSTQLRSDLTNTIQNQITSFSEQNYLNYISNLSVTDDYEISRGHDVVRILVTIIKRNSNRNIQKKSFSSKLRDHYSENSFYSSQLFQSIRTYCDTIHKEIW